jgi:K+-sensing histidine kinase KdpD
VRRTFQVPRFGLAFAKAIVEAHGGQIGLLNRPVLGSAFQFSLLVFRQGAGPHHSKNSAG